MPKSKPFWAFGHPDDDSIEAPEVIPPGFRFARSIPPEAPYGKQLSCRSCGAVVASTDNAISRHKQFHERLLAVANALGMNYAPENPNVVKAFAEVVVVQNGDVDSKDGQTT